MTEILFRNENFRGSGMRDAIEVMSFEMFELNNIDIPTTLKNTIFKNYPELIKFMDGLIDKILNNKFDYSDEEIFRQETRYISKKILSHINCIIKKDIKYVLWLTDLNNAMYGMYGISQGFLEYGDSIDAYKVGAVLLSDVGNDGKLYGYEEIPTVYATLYASGDHPKSKIESNFIHKQGFEKEIIKEENNNEN